MKTLHPGRHEHERCRKAWHLLAALLASLTICIAHPLIGQAQEPASAVGASADREATLMYLNRPIVVLRATIGAARPVERVERAHRRLAELEPSYLEKPIEVAPIVYAGQQGFLLTVGGQPLFGIAPGDVDPDRLGDAASLAEDAKGRLAAAFAARLEQGRLPTLLKGIGLTVAGMLVGAGLIWAIWRIRLRLTQRFHLLISDRVKRATAQRFNWAQYGYALSARLTQLVATFAILLILYLWLVYSLQQFPVTEPVGKQLGSFLVDLIVGLAAKAAESIPGIVTVIVILLIAQAVVQVTVNIFSAAEGGRVSIPVIKPDTASATRRILRIVIWGIGFAIAYPYIPGSDSAAFQGLSVLFGLMITLGSTGIVAQMMSGTVLVYSRALHPGEYVSTGDVEGVVSEMGAISTKLITPRNEEITIPNAVLVESTIKNYSRTFGGQSMLVSTKITIGYDTPWRQVHAMMLLAAEQTPGLVRSPKPYVIQRALSDFYVEYELLAVTDRPRDQLAILTALHSKIQDTFNEHGVQIMSPQYYEQPPTPLVVPKEKWFAAPASQDDQEQGPLRASAS